jgi:hypothetical protein
MAYAGIGCNEIVAVAGRAGIGKSDHTTGLWRTSKPQLDGQRVPRRVRAMKETGSTAKEGTVKSMATSSVKTKGLEQTYDASQDSYLHD